MKKFAATFLALIILFSLLSLSNVFAQDSEQIVSPQFDQVKSFSDDLMSVKKDGKWGLMNKQTGAIVVEPTYNFIGDLREGLAPFIKEYKQAGYLDKNGNIAIEPVFEGTRDFSEGLASVYLNGKMGVIDKSGSIVIEPKYVQVGEFHGGLAHVQINNYNQQGYIDRSGNMVIDPVYSFATDFINGLAYVTKDLYSKQGYLIDTTGTKIREDIYNNEMRKISDSIVEVRLSEDGHKALLDNNGNTIESGHTDIGPISEGLIRVKKDNKWEYINETGKVVIDPMFDYASDFSEGLARAGIDGKYGFINHEGQFVIEPRYDRVNDFKNGVAVVNKGWVFGCGLWCGTYGYIDKTGKEVIKLSYNLAYDFDDEGLAVVKEEHHNEIIDKSGNIGEVIQFQYKIIDKSGNIVYEFEDGAYDSLEPFSQRLMITYAGKKFGFIANPNHPSAYPTASKVKVNDKEITLEAYNINGNNYFKLRDLAAVLNTTEKNFDVSYDETKGAINLTLKKAYTKSGGELVISDTIVSKNATLASSKLFVNDKAVKLNAYNIDGNNFFKLRDIAQINNFGVTWDETTKTIGIDTKSVYEIDGKVIYSYDQRPLMETIVTIAAKYGFTLSKKFDYKDKVDNYYFVNDVKDSLSVEQGFTSDYRGIDGYNHLLSMLLPTSDAFDEKQPIISLVKDIITTQINTDSSELFQKLKDLAKTNTIDYQHPLTGKIKFNGVETDYWLGLRNEHFYSLEIKY